MNWLRKAPTPVLITAIIVGGLLPLGSIAGFVALEMTGSPTTDYRAFLNLLMNGAILALSGIGAVGGISAARSASNAEDQTNGQLTAKEDELSDLRRQVAALQDWKAGH
jgi:zinc transporter ZupT